MSVLITSIVLFVISALVLTFTAVYMDKKGFSGSKKYIERSKKGYKFIPLSLLSFVLILFASFTKVPANSVGIIYDEVHGGVQEKTYSEGFHSKSIFEHITTISTANRSALVKTTGQTNDGQYATFELSIIYKIKKEDAGKFYKVTNADDIPQDALDTIIKSSLQSSTIKFNIFELLSTELENARIDFKEDLSNALYGLFKIKVG